MRLGKSLGMRLENSLGMRVENRLGMRLENSLGMRLENSLGVRLRGERFIRQMIVFPCKLTQISELAATCSAVSMPFRLMAPSCHFGQFCCCCCCSFVWCAPLLSLFSPACLPPSLPPCLSVCLPVCLPACPPPSLLVCLPVCLPPSPLGGWLQRHCWKTSSTCSQMSGKQVLDTPYAGPLAPTSYC